MYYYDRLRVWKNKTKLAMPPTENIRKVGDQFIALLQQLDTDEIVKLSFSDQIYAEMYKYYIQDSKNAPDIQIMELIQCWICVIGNEILKMLKFKISKIEMLSEMGANQLKVDINYILNILSNFSLDSTLFSYIRSIIYGLNFSSIKRIRELQNKNLGSYKKILKERADYYFNLAELNKDSILDSHLETDFDVVSQVIQKIMNSKDEDFNENTEEEEEEDEEEQIKT